MLVDFFTAGEAKSFDLSDTKQDARRKTMGGRSAGGAENDWHGEISCQMGEAFIPVDD